MRYARRLMKQLMITHLVQYMQMSCNGVSDISTVNIPAKDIFTTFGCKSVAQTRESRIVCVKALGGFL
jgi:hypothetical protein